MKRVLAILAGAILAVSVPLAAAQDTKTTRGSVTAVGGSSITVKTGDATQTFNIDDKTDITARGASTATRTARAAGKAGPTIADIVKVGDGVEIKYHEAGMHAASVRVLPQSANLNPPPPPPPPAPKTMTATGVVTAVTGTSLTLKTKEGEQTFVIDAKTEVVGKGLGTKSAQAKEAGKTTVLSDFVGAGDEVGVRYTERDGAKHASEVRVDRKAVK
jgi:hypothetical protein